MEQHKTIRGSWVLPTPRLKSSLNVSRRVPKHQSWHPHSSSSLHTIAQAGKGQGGPMLKTPESSTLHVSPLTAETSDSTSDREANKPPPINSTHVRKNQQEGKKKISRSCKYSRVLAESITHKFSSKRELIYVVEWMCPDFECPLVQSKTAYLIPYRKVLVLTKPTSCIFHIKSRKNH